MKPHCLLSLSVAAVLHSAAVLAFAGGLVDFNSAVRARQITGSDARFDLAKSATGLALRVNTGHTQNWPGVTIVAPSGHWDLSSFGVVEVTVKNRDAGRLTVHCRVDNPGADGQNHCVNGTRDLAPGETVALRVTLNRASGDRLGGKLFGMRGYPVAPGGPGTVDPANITQLVVFVNRPTTDHAFEIESVRADGTYQPPTAWTRDADPFFPLIDTFGQYRHKDWPGKTHSLAELTARCEAERAALAADSGPAEWDDYGGWKTGPQLKATGFFRTEKYRGKWWLVDPAGRLFFSTGIDSVRLGDATPIEERDDWFADFPGRDPEFAGFLATGFALKGHYAGRTVRTFSFAGANLRRKYGPDWRAASADVIQLRLRRWGLNTIGMWADESVRGLRRTPYVDALNAGRARMIAGSEGYWGKFPDPFDPGFREGVRRAMAGKRGQSAGDPWCLGYFSGNEMAWGDETSLAEGALRSPADQPAKQAFVADLRAKYGDIARLNAAWGTSHASWDALLAATPPPDKSRAREDLTAFYSRVAAEYFRIVREAIKEVAPNQLFLGCRFAWVNSRAATVAAKYCDVVSYNLYRRSVADFKFDGGADVPLLIGEFHFGALDRGMFHTGLVPVENQAARAAAYADYVRGALRHPQFVGCHWFEYQDEPTTGRTYDEENYQIGFVDVADTPYAETVKASRAVAQEMYRLRAGN